MSYTELQNKAVTVRKEHRCVWCGETIEGQAQYRAYLFDGVFNSDYMHPECYEAMLKSDDESLEDGFDAVGYYRGRVAEWDPGWEDGDE